MKRCYIHIGVHKTGTTSIQTALAESRAALVDEGLYVPASGWIAPNLGAHHNIGFELNEDNRFRKGRGSLESLEQEVSERNPETVLLSSESFSFSASHPERLARLREPFVRLGYEITWIIYLRSFPEWAESAYTEVAKNLKITHPFADWFDHLNGSLSVGLRPDEVVTPLRVAGDSVCVRSYARTRGNLLADFFEQVGLPGFESRLPDDGIRENLRSSVLTMEFLRHGGLLMARTAHKEKRPVIRKQVRELLPEIPASPTYRGLTEELAHRLCEQTRPHYESILEHHAPDQSFEEFFPLQESYQPCTMENYDCPTDDLLKLYQCITRLCTGRPLAKASS